MSISGHSPLLPYYLPSVRGCCQSFPVLMDLLTVETSYKWFYTVCGLLCLAFLTWQDVFEIHEHCSIYHYFIPVYGWMMFRCVCVYVYICMYVPVCLAFHPLRNIRVLFIFWLSWIMLLWPLVQKYLSTCFHSIFEKNLRVELLGHVVSKFNFLRNCQNVFHFCCSIS